MNCFFISISHVFLGVQYSFSLIGLCPSQDYIFASCFFSICSTSSLGMAVISMFAILYIEQL